MFVEALKQPVLETNTCSHTSLHTDVLGDEVLLVRYCVYVNVSLRVSDKLCMFVPVVILACT